MKLILVFFIVLNSPALFGQTELSFYDFSINCPNDWFKNDTADNYTLILYSGIDAFGKRDSVLLTVLSAIEPWENKQVLKSAFKWQQKMIDKSFTKTSSRVLIEKRKIKIKKFTYFSYLFFEQKVQSCFTRIYKYYLLPYSSYTLTFIPCIGKSNENEVGLEILNSFNLKLISN